MKTIPFPEGGAAVLIASDGVWDAIDFHTAARHALASTTAPKVDVRLQPSLPPDHKSTCLPLRTEAIHPAFLTHVPWQPRCSRNHPQLSIMFAARLQT